MQEFMPLFPIMAMGILVFVVGLISALRERKAWRKEHPQEQQRKMAGR